MPSIVLSSVPTKVHGLPLPEDRFARRFRNKAPLAIRHIVAQEVLDRWSSDPIYVANTLNSSVVQENKQEQEQSQTPQHQEDDGFSSDGGDAPSPEYRLELGQLLPVMVAEDTKNFMDNPRFTTKISMSSIDIATKILLPLKSINSVTAAEKGSLNCPLCENKISDTIDQSRFYYRGKLPPSLYSDLHIPKLLKSLSLPTEPSHSANTPNKDLMRIWMSLAGATTPLHYDRCHGILIQLVGRKRFVVFSHEDTNNIYSYDGVSGPGHASKVRGLGHCFPYSNTVVAKDDKHLDNNMAELLERWPKIKNTDPWVIDLEPGDALYTPPGFWHEVTSVDNSISVTLAWDMDKDELQNIPRHLGF